MAKRTFEKGVVGLAGLWLAGCLLTDPIDEIKRGTSGTPSLPPVTKKNVVGSGVDVDGSAGAGLPHKRGKADAGGQRASGDTADGSDVLMRGEAGTDGLSDTHGHGGEGGEGAAPGAEGGRREEGSGGDTVSSGGGAGGRDAGSGGNRAGHGGQAGWMDAGGRATGGGAVMGGVPSSGGVAAAPKGGVGGQAGIPEGGVGGQAGIPEGGVGGQAGIPEGGVGGQAGTPNGRSLCQDGQTRSCADDGFEGSCAAGIETCKDGIWAPCSIAPAPTDSCETEGDDADCDGRSNGGCICVMGQTRSCAEDGEQGNCAAGTETCLSDGTWGPCSIAPEASDACTTGDDANCNGVPTEECDCTEGQTRTCEEGGLHGECAAGTETCSAATGQWGPCSIQPSAKDTCVAGNDDNCNGSVNEGCPCIAGDTRSCSLSGLLGKCAAGVEVCDSAAQWGACSIQPSATDTCVAGNDDNCNGMANEGCLCIIGATRTCGPCGDGQQACTDGKAGTYGMCVGGTQPTTYYRDADGDGHGNPDVPSATCASAPVGYVTSGDDCCDSNSLVRPGNTAWYEEAQTTCPRVLPHDYDCDGDQTQEITGYFEGQCIRPDDCTMPNGKGYWNAGPGDWPIPACGDGASFFATCKITTSGGGCSSVAITRRQKCH
ncbi:hypothetical protein ACFL5O_01600 [Myxococcota bacterium]